jgi:hypothetical protein
MIYVGLDPRFDMEQLGFIPSFLSEDDPRGAREQLDSNYAHGGGWRPLEGWKIVNKNILIIPIIQYPGDPPLKPFAMTGLRDEVIYFYPHAQVMIVQPDGHFEVARMD